MPLRIILFSCLLFIPINPLLFGQTAAVTSLQGNAKFFRAGQWAPVTKGTMVQEGDRIITEENAELDISLDGKAGIRMLPESETIIKKFEPKQTLVELKIGNIIANLEKYEDGSQFEVETPVAVLAARGTQFWGRVSSAGQFQGTTFAVREGMVNVRVKESNENFVLEPGEALDIPIEEGEPAVREAYEEEMEALEQAEEIDIVEVEASEAATETGAESTESKEPAGLSAPAVQVAVKTEEQRKKEKTSAEESKEDLLLEETPNEKSENTNKESSARSTL